MRQILKLFRLLSAYFKPQEAYDDYANRPYSKHVLTVRELRAKYGIDPITPLQRDSTPNTDEPG